jgi:hypothetical protein
MANKHCLLVVVSVEVKVVVAILAGEATAVDAKKSARYRKFLHANKKKRTPGLDPVVPVVVTAVPEIR